jgi:hypothetical protein
MLTVYRAQDQTALDAFISKTMSNGGWNGWAFAQPDCGKVVFPAQFVLVTDAKIKLAAVQVLN